MADGRVNGSKAFSLLKGTVCWVHGGGEELYDVLQCWLHPAVRPIPVFTHSMWCVGGLESPQLQIKGRGSSIVETSASVRRCLMRGQRYAFSPTLRQGPVIMNYSSRCHHLCDPNMCSPPYKSGGLTSPAATRMTHFRGGSLPCWLVRGMIWYDWCI